MKIALLQLNMTVGDVAGNAERLEKACREAHANGARVCVSTELALSGYPPRDLLLYPSFVESCWQACATLASELSGGPVLLAGIPEPNTEGPGNPLFNSVAMCRDGQIRGTFRKTLLPTYDVFDERRYFSSGNTIGIAMVDEFRLGVTVCEDVWNDKDFWKEKRHYLEDPMEAMGKTSIDVVVNLSASPFTLGKQTVRENMLSSLAKKHRVPVLYANQVGGNDDLIFDGRSMAFDRTGEPCGRAPGFAEGILYVDLRSMPSIPASRPMARAEEARHALVLGLRDYVRKCGFSEVVLGLSGGVDSALTAAIAAEALGPDKVTGVLMPSPWSSRGSIDDSLALADNLGIATRTIPIEPIMDSFDKALSESFAGRDRDVTEENIQSRIRGNLLMALSNKWGAMLLTTGNKSELSVGYCTIYGDMAGGLAVIADVPKLLVYDICRHMNGSGREIIPQAILDKPPSAELRPGQKDEDSLPPYEVLDPILERLVERHESVDDLVGAGFERQVVERIVRLVSIAEFKRRQAPPGLKITDHAFGVGWRMPVAGRSLRAV